MSFAARVQALAFEVISDPTSSPADRQAARAALVNSQGATVAKLQEVTAQLTPNDRAALHRVAALIAGEPAPPDLRARTVAEHFAAILELDPSGDELRRALTRPDLDEDLEPEGPGVIAI